MKAREKAGRIDGPESVLAGVPVALPGLTRAVKLQGKAAKVGFDWPSVDNVFDKIEEEIAELRQAPPDKREEEFGDLLFAIANVGRHMGIDPESALRAANGKFERRFHHIEERLRERGTRPADSTLEEMDALWDEAKEREKA